MISQRKKIFLIIMLTINFSAYSGINHNQSQNATYDLYSFCRVFSRVANITSGWHSLSDRWQGNPPYIESTNPLQESFILKRLLYPEASKLREFPTIDLLWSHLAKTGNPDKDGEDIAGLTSGFAASLHIPVGFKHQSEFCGKMTNLRMGPKTSFYFYISLLTLMRDMDDLSVKEFPFTSEKPFDLKKTLRWWARHNKTSIGGSISPEGETIIGDILTHRSEYFELLAYRFFEKNEHLDRWGKNYHRKRDDGTDLGTHQDNWKSVQLELEDYRYRLGGHDFATNIAILTKTPIEKILELKPDSYQSRSSIEGSSSSSNSSDELELLLKPKME